MKKKTSISLILFSTILFISIGCSSTGSNIPRSIDHDEAIIILGGELGSPKDLAHVTKYFRENSDYDIYNIQYRSKKGIEYCSDNLNKKINKLPLEQYKKVNFFCFILGGITLREYLKKEELGNLGNIVLIRGPIEEKLAQVAIDVYPDFLIKAVKGKTLFDLSKNVYKDFGKVSNDIGIIIETKPNKLADKLVRKSMRGKRDIRYEMTHFHPDTLFVGHKDFTFLALDHNEMYQNPQMYLPAVINFIQNGTFGEYADRSQRFLTLNYFPAKN